MIKSTWIWIELFLVFSLQLQQHGRNVMHLLKLFASEGGMNNAILIKCNTKETRKLIFHYYLREKCFPWQFSWIKISSRYKEMLLIASEGMAFNMTNTDKKQHKAKKNLNYFSRGQVDLGCDYLIRIALFLHSATLELDSKHSLTWSTWIRKSWCCLEQPAVLSQIKLQKQRSTGTWFK